MAGFLSLLIRLVGSKIACTLENTIGDRNTNKMLKMLSLKYVRNLIAKMDQT